MERIYGVVIAHDQGQALERVLPGIRCATLDEAQTHADVWTRRHGHRRHGTDKCGFYAYADRITRPRILAR